MRATKLCFSILDAFFSCLCDGTKETITQSNNVRILTSPPSSGSFNLFWPQRQHSLRSDNRSHDQRSQSDKKRRDVLWHLWWNSPCSHRTVAVAVRDLEQGVNQHQEALLPEWRHSVAPDLQIWPIWGFFSGKGNFTMTADEGVGVERFLRCGIGSPFVCACAAAAPKYLWLNCFFFVFFCFLMNWFIFESTWQKV